MIYKKYKLLGDIALGVSFLSYGVGIYLYRKSFEVLR